MEDDYLMRKAKEMVCAYDPAMYNHPVNRAMMLKRILHDLQEIYAKGKNNARNM